MAKAIKLNSSGIRELLSSNEMKKAIGTEAAAQGKIVKNYICGDRVDFLVRRGALTNANRTDRN